MSNDSRALTRDELEHAVLMKSAREAMRLLRISERMIADALMRPRALERDGDAVRFVSALGVVVVTKVGNCGRRFVTEVLVV